MSSIRTSGSSIGGRKVNYDQLPSMAAELVRRQVAVIFATPTAAALAAKAATKTIPTVFVTGGDPVELGLVASLNRPGGNVTGATFFVGQLASRQLELLRELVPKAVAVGVFVNPNAPANAEPQIRDLQIAANAIGLRLDILDVGSEDDAKTAFANLIGGPVDALLVTADGFFNNQLRDAIVRLAAHHRLPTIYAYREPVVSGGLICYTSSTVGAVRQAGVYTGRILKGAKPSDLPVTQPTKFELVINLKTAKALGLDRAEHAARDRRRGDRVMRRREFITVLGGAARVAACGARAAARADASHRRAHAGSRERSGSADPRRGVRAGPGAIGLDRSAATCGSTTAGARAMPNRLRKHAAELVALAPDVILASGAAAVGPLQQATRTVPIVFAVAADPVGAGFVESLARPGGNVTGFTTYRIQL